MRLLLVGLSGLAGLLGTPGPPRLPSPALAPAAPPVVRLGRIVAHGVHPSPWQAFVAYPVVTGRDKAARRMNVTLRGEAKRWVANFVHELPSKPLGKGAGAQVSTIRTTVQTDVLTPRLAGFSALTTTYLAGAAHGVTLVTTDTFNVVTGSRWHLPGLFRPGRRFLGLLSQESRRLLRRRLGRAVDPPSTLDAGTTPQLVNFEAWAVTPFGLQLTFSSYQVGPYAIGTPSILIPFRRIRRLVRPGGPLALAETDRPVRTPLLPAARASAVDECWKDARAPGDLPPPRCAQGRVNVAAWDLQVASGDPLLSLGRAARPEQVLRAACADEARLRHPAAVRGVEAMMAAYFAWRFSTAPLNRFPASCRRRR